MIRFNLIESWPKRFEPVFEPVPKPTDSNLPESNPHG